LRAVLQAGRVCDDAAAAPLLTALLSGIGLAASRQALRAALPGGDGREQIRFHANDAWFPWRSHAVWFLLQMARWHWLDAATDLVAAAREVYRPDLLAPAVRAEGLELPRSGARVEHGDPARILAAAEFRALSAQFDRMDQGGLPYQPNY
jgi:hypothetical protein